jgi:hypothetical protein
VNRRQVEFIRGVLRVLIMKKGKTVRGWGLRTGRALAAIAALCGLCLSGVALAAGSGDDVNGAFLIGLFNQACVPYRGNTDKISEFAFEHHFLPITNPAALDVFVGPGEHGKAWQVPSPTHQHFALSIRGTTEACVVWAQTADAAFVESAFVKEIESIAKPGIEVKKRGEETADTPVGKAKSISYLVWPSDSKKGIEFTLTTSERAGGPFQASIQMAKIVIE